MKKQYGFTLIELMVTTAVLVIIVSAAVPAFKSAFEQKNIPGIARLFERSIKLARTEAINRNSTVSVKSSSGTTDWSQGWFLEFTNADDEDKLIRRFEALPGSPTFTSDIFTDDPGMQILPNGQAVSLGNFSLLYADNCSAGSFTFAFLSSGFLKKSESECP